MRQSQLESKLPIVELHRSQTPRVSVIIPAMSTSELLGACLRSLARFGPKQIPYEIIVVLNEASPDDAAALRETVTGLEVVASPVNLGLAGGTNRGRSLARGEFVVTLHDDAEIEPGWLESLVETADAYPEAGAIGGKVLFSDGRLQNAGMILWRDASISRPGVGKVPAPGDFDRLRPIDFCGTSSLLVRGSAWDAIGGLDERFYPAYRVDADLSMALRQRGLFVLYQPGSRIRHHRFASSTPRFRKFVFQRNRLLFIEKWAAALEEHEPADRDSLEAVERALARAEAFASRCRRRGTTAIEALPNRMPFDPILQERWHFDKSRALQKTYVAHLTELIDAAERELASHARSATLTAIKHGWRRIYRRLRSLQRRLGNTRLSRRFRVVDRPR
jgi:GT2 family glycosyltransferase